MGIIEEFTRFIDAIEEITDDRPRRLRLPWRVVSFMASETGVRDCAISHPVVVQGVEVWPGLG